MAVLGRPAPTTLVREPLYSRRHKGRCVYCRLRAAPRATGERSSTQLASLSTNVLHSRLPCIVTLPLAFDIRRCALATQNFTKRELTRSFLRQPGNPLGVVSYLCQRSHALTGREDRAASALGSFFHICPLSLPSCFQGLFFATYTCAAGLLVISVLSCAADGRPHRERDRLDAAPPVEVGFAEWRRPGDAGACPLASRLSPAFLQDPEHSASHLDVFGDGKHALITSHLFNDSSYLRRDLVLHELPPFLKSLNYVEERDYIAHKETLHARNKSGDMTSAPRPNSRPGSGTFLPVPGMLLREKNKDKEKDESKDSDRSDDELAGASRRGAMALRRAQSDKRRPFMHWISVHGSPALLLLCCSLKS
jgi:hypothetical protein